MELSAGKVAVVTGAGSGIGLALAHRFATAGMHVVLADIDRAALDLAEAEVRAVGVETLSVITDVGERDQIEALGAATMERFGGVHLVCNNAGVSPLGDPWFGPIETFEWVMKVNFWGVVHGCRTFLPLLVQSGGGHIVNTASIAGLMPIGSASYDASKHAVVAASENLFLTLQAAMLPVGVSCLCPGWVRTRILDAQRHWAPDAGVVTERNEIEQISFRHTERAIAEGMPPAQVADHVAEAVTAGRFWVLPDPEFTDLAIARFHTIAERLDPVRPVAFPGMPPFSEIAAEVMAALGLS